MFPWTWHKTRSTYPWPSMACWTSNLSRVALYGRYRVLEPTARRPPSFRSLLFLNKEYWTAKHWALNTALRSDLSGVTEELAYTPKVCILTFLVQVATTTIAISSPALKQLAIDAIYREVSTSFGYHEIFVPIPYAHPLWCTLRALRMLPLTNPVPFFSFRL